MKDFIILVITGVLTLATGVILGTKRKTNSEADKNLADADKSLAEATDISVDTMEKAIRRLEVDMTRMQETIIIQARKIEALETDLREERKGREEERKEKITLMEKIARMEKDLKEYRSYNFPKKNG